MNGLPADSAFARALAEGQAPWTQEHELLALIVDRLGALQYWQQMGLVGKAVENPTPPEPFPRPQQIEQAPAPTTVGIRQFFEMFQGE